MATVPAILVEFTVAWHDVATVPAILVEFTVVCSGLLGMAWLLFLRYYVVAGERRKAMVLSLKDNMTMTPSPPAGQVPWLVLFKQPAFW